MSFYSGAEQILSDIKKQRASYKNTVQTAENLPSSLKEGFRKKGDPKLDDAIVTAENKTLGGAIAGLEKYQDVFNPFKRRNLAEKYQSSLSRTQASLYGERDRRQGNITDYINAWAGTYGAKAKAEQAALQGMESEFSMEMQLGGKREAAYNRSRSGNKAKDPNTIAMINMGFNEGKNWEEMAAGLAATGIDVGRGSVADREFRRVFGHKTIEVEDAESELKTIIDKENRGIYQDRLDEIESGDSSYEVDELGNIVERQKDFWTHKTKENLSVIMRNPNI